MAKERESGIELLRIVSMLFVLILHFIGSIGLPTRLETERLPIDSLKVILECAALIGVNCFVLISGYFGIRPRIHSFVSLFLQCVFYSLGIYIILGWLGYLPFNSQETTSALLVFSQDRWWFVSVYVVLYMISPMLNKFAEHASRKEFVNALFLLAVVDIFWGFFLQSPYNPEGYTLYHFIFIYMTGRYLKFWYQPGKNKNRYLAVFIFCILLNAGIYFGKLSFIPYSVGKYFGTLHYHNPLTIIAAITFFMYFRNLHIKSKAINWISTSAFAIYLIHLHPQVYWPHLRPFIQKIACNADNYFTGILLLTLLLITIFIGCILIDKIRMAITEPVARVISKTGEKLITRYRDKKGI